MTNYSQRDWRWSWKKLGTSSVTIGGYGCAITALGTLANKQPDQVNELLKNNMGFLQQNLVIWAQACKLLGLEWKGQTSKPITWPCIAQVRGNGFPMHFVVWLGNNQIIDPWDGRQKVNPYLVVQFNNIAVPAPKVQPVSSGFNVRVDKAVAAVRVQPNSKSALGGSQMLYRGDVFKAVAVVVGESINGNNKWYKSAKGNYVWSGGLTRV